jgi:hypothetical protein
MPITLFPDLKDLTSPNVTVRVGDGLVFFLTAGPGSNEPHPVHPNYRAVRLIDLSMPAGPMVWRLSPVSGLRDLRVVIGWDYADLHVHIQAKLGGKISQGSVEVKLKLPRRVGFQRIHRDGYHDLAVLLPPM